MKKMVVMTLICGLLLVFTACGVDNTGEQTDNAAGPQEAPPRLELYLNEEESPVFLSPRTYEWKIDNGDGTMTGINADAAHPLDVLNELETVDTAKCGGAVEIILGEGMEVTAVSWWDAAETDYDNAQEVSGEVIAANKTVYRLPVEAGRVYEIHADYGDAGDSFYAFMAK